MWETKPLISTANTLFRFGITVTQQGVVGQWVEGWGKKQRNKCVNLREVKNVITLIKLVLRQTMSNTGRFHHNLVEIAQYCSGNQTDLWAHVLFALADVTGTPPNPKSPPSILFCIRRITSVYLIMDRFVTKPRWLKKAGWASDEKIIFSLVTLFQPNREGDCWNSSKSVS